MQKRISITQAGTGQKGTTAVEFAVIVAVLLTIVFGILEFGIFFLQQHYVTNAAREGARIGVKANNYNCFDGVPAKDCTALTDRKTVVDTRVKDYLETLYRRDEVTVEIPTPVFDSVTEKKILTVTVTTPNFFPTLLTGLVPGFSLPENLTQSAVMNYEDPSEP